MFHPSHLLYLTCLTDVVHILLVLPTLPVFVVVENFLPTLPVFVVVENFLPLLPVFVVVENFLPTLPVFVVVENFLPTVSHSALSWGLTHFTNGAWSLLPNSCNLLNPFYPQYFTHLIQYVLPISTTVSPLSHPWCFSFLSHPYLRCFNLYFLSSY